MFERIKRFYDENLWTLQQVKDAVRVGVITPEEFFIITGEIYEA